MAHKLLASSTVFYDIFPYLQFGGAKDNRVHFALNPKTSLSNPAGTHFSIVIFVDKCRKTFEMCGYI